MLKSINTAFSSLYFVIDCSESGINLMNEDEKLLFQNTVQNQASNYIQQIKSRYYNILNQLEASKIITSGQKIIYKNHLTPYVGWSDNIYTIEFRFYSSTASRLFITSSKYSGALNEESSFSTKTTEKFKNIFSQTPSGIVTTSLEQYFTNSVESALLALGEQSFEKFTGINYYYLFISENPRLHSSNANEVLNLGSSSVFCFYSLENNNEIEFEFYVVQANAVAYYLLALAITFVFISIYLIILYFKKDKKEIVENSLNNKE